MEPVVTMVSGMVPAERIGGATAVYREKVKEGLPPGLERTLLLGGTDGRMAVVSLWRSRRDLEMMIATGEEPFARRLIREAGGVPEVAVYDVLGAAERPPEANDS